jgi:hypothetical protein
LSGAAFDNFRVRTFPEGSGIRVCEELGVGSGVPEGVRLGVAGEVGSADMGGNEGENTEAGLFGGKRCTFL